MSIYSEYGVGCTSAAFIADEEVDVDYELYEDDGVEYVADGLRGAGLVVDEGCAEV